jgi:chemotaxis protein MotB
MSAIMPPPLARLHAEHRRSWRQAPWLVTFADMAILLMCFFILVLSYTDFDLSRFQLVSGSLNHTFGHPRLVPVIGEQANDERSGGRDAQQSAAGLIPLSRMSGDADQPTSNADYTKILGQALVDGKVEIVRMGEAVALHFTALEARGRDPLGLKQTTVEALEDIARLSQMREKTLTSAPPVAMIQPSQTPESQDNSAQVVQATHDVDRAFDALKNDLNGELNDQTVQLVRGRDRITIRIGTAGAFAPASAELTASAHQLIARVRQISFDGHPDIVVAGHTDNKPITTERYHDNWELASARAIAVVRELARDQLVPSDTLVATSYGDTRPLMPNDSAEHREQNRRVEIELHYRDEH